MRQLVLELVYVTKNFANSALDLWSCKIIIMRFVNSTGTLKNNVDCFVH